MLGLARRAGKVESGAFLTETAVKSGKAFLVLVAGDASANTLRKISSMCEYRNIPCIVCADMESLGKSLGQEMRSAAAVTDRSFASAIRTQAMEENS